MPSPSLPLALLILLCALGIFVIEMFVPSAGTLFVLGASCVIASVTVAFFVGPLTGWSFLLLVVIMALALPPLFFQIWRRSPVGRRMILGDAADGDDARLTHHQAANPAPFADLLGRVGSAVTPLRPVGKVDFEGQRVDAVAEGVMIEVGEVVRVVEVVGNRIVVRKFAAPQSKMIDIGDGWAAET